MLKENWRLITRLEKVGDILMICLAFVVAYYSRGLIVDINALFGNQLKFRGTLLAPIKDYTIVLLLSLIVYPIMLYMLGAYNSMRLRSSWQLFRTFVLASILVFFILTSALFSLRLDLSRSFIAIFCGTIAFASMLERYVVLVSLRYLRRKGFNFRNVMLCGLSRQAVRLAREINSKPELGIRVRAFADLQARVNIPGARVLKFRSDMRAAGVTNLGKFVFGINELEKSLRDYAIDEVIFTDISGPMNDLEDAVAICSEQGIRTTIAADLFSAGLVKSGLSYFGGIPLIHFQTPPGDKWELNVKRVLDVVLSGLGLIFLAIPFVIISFLIRASSAGPVFFVQRRVGLNGRLFSLYKFRSMYDGAEKEKAELLARNEMKGPAFKLKEDPRVTPIGKLLCKYSIDELPQLWNVFVGDMSLVGPRPPVPEEVNMYVRRYRRRLSMRPGLTCTWQVGGRNEINDFESWVNLDLQYIDNWSLMSDFKLIAKTIPAVILGSGAR